MKKLDVKRALENYYYLMEKDAGVRSEGLKNSELGWNAYRDLLLRMSNERSDERSLTLHASTVSGTVGWECSRTYFYTLLNHPQQSTFHSALYKRFDIGHATHNMVYKRIGPALERMYPELTFHELVFEKKIPADEDSFITGTLDIKVVYSQGDREPVRVIIDVKSSSTSQMAKRSKAHGIELEPQYMRQVQLYVHREKAHYGVVLFWDIGFPHPFAQVDVQPNPRVYELFRKRERKVLELMEAGREVQGTPGPWCSSCPWSYACPSNPSRETSETP